MAEGKNFIRDPDLVLRDLSVEAWLKAKEKEVAGLARSLEVDENTAKILLISGYNAGWARMGYISGALKKLKAKG